MTVNGHYEGDQYIPEPSVRKFELELAKWIGDRLCDGCRKRLGNDPRRIKNGRHYHPTCAPQAMGGR